MISMDEDDVDYGPTLSVECVVARLHAKLSQSVMPLSLSLSIRAVQCIISCSTWREWRSRGGRIVGARAIWKFGYEPRYPRLSCPLGLSTTAGASKVPLFLLLLFVLLLPFPRCGWDLGGVSQLVFTNRLCQTLAIPTCLFADRSHDVGVASRAGIARRPADLQFAR